MNINRASCDPSNFRKGRPLNFRPEAIVIHTAMGSLKGLEMQMSDRNSATSFHYGVDLNGDLRQFVDDTDTAFHAGVVEQPTWTLLRASTNPNFYTIGVCFAGIPTDDFTNEQYDAGAQLIAGVADRWGIPIDADHVITHRRIRATRNCPGERVDPSRFIAAAGQASPPPSVVARPIECTTVATVNLRSNAPNSSAPLAGTVPPGTVLHAAGFVTGERVRGNAFWFMDGAGVFFWAGATDVPDPTKRHDLTTDEQQLTAPPPPVQDLAEPSIDRKTFVLPRGQFIDEITTKDLIVLHFTAGGSAESAFNTWMGTTERVGTAYLVDTDGKIYETFDPSRWAFHLGLHETQRHDRRSIGIEIANLGPLDPAPGDPNTLNWWAGKKYCGVSDTARYVRSKYRGHDFYAAFPEPQIASVAALVHHLCNRFKIPRAIPPPDQRAEKDLAFFDKFTGIATHANFRTDKFDIGPAFDWSRLGIDVGAAAGA